MGKQQEKRDGDMNGLPETIADIIAEMRRGTKLLGYWHSSDLNEILAYHADRLEAAHKREKEAAERHKPGNAAKLRDALREIYNCSEVLTGSILDDPNANARAAAKRYAAMICEIAASALAAHQEMYPHAPNDEAERDLIDRANRGNAWLVSHGYEPEKTIWDKEEAPCL